MWIFIKAMYWYWQRGIVDADFQHTKIKGSVITEKGLCSALRCDMHCALDCLSICCKSGIELAKN